ncbi:hypothetical protein RJ640_025129, partial [Escallonia rubra]
VLPDLFRIVCTCEDGLKEFITWKLGTLVSIVRQHIRKYLPELLSLVSELWSSFSLPATNRPVHGSPVQCGDTELEKKIDEKIEQFIDRVEKHPNKKNQICLSFYEVKSKQPSWFTNKVERLHWEQWYINLNVAQHPKTHSGKSHHSKVTGHISALVHHLKLVLDGRMSLPKYVHHIFAICFNVIARIGNPGPGLCRQPQFFLLFVQITFKSQPYYSVTFGCNIHDNGIEKVPKNMQGKLHTYHNTHRKYD